MGHIIILVFILINGLLQTIVLCPICENSVESTVSICFIVSAEFTMANVSKANLTAFNHLID